MVLRTIFLAGLALAAVAPASGCLKSQPTARLAQPVAVERTVLLETDTSTDLLMGPVDPRHHLALVDDELAARNLVVKRAACEGEKTSLQCGTVARRLAERRATQDRLAILAETAAADSPLVLLVEAKAKLYGQLEGRYRWTVSVRASIARRDQPGAAQSESFDVPVVLEFSHEGPREALALAEATIARRVAALVDRALPGLTDQSLTPTTATPGVASDGDDVIYFVMVDRFANGDPANDRDVNLADPQAFHGGDLQGVIDHLGDIADLGVKTVWISPVYKTRSAPFDGHGAYHGYWVTDHDAIDDRFGGEAGLVALRDALHARGMRLMLDVVMNHVAWDAPLTAAHPDWFHGKGAITDWNDPAQLETGDLHGLPDLASERDEVYAYLLGHARRLVERVRPDGFRLDAIRHVPMRVWARFTRDVRAFAGDGFTLVGELLNGTPEALGAAFTEGGFDGLFDFPLAYAMIDVFCKGAPASRLGVVLTDDRVYDDPSRLITLLDNHDLPRVASLCANDVGKVRLALQFQLTARGTPSITYGTEIGMAGAHEPENRADMRWDAERAFAGTIRDVLAQRRQQRSLSHGRAQLILAADDTFFAYVRATRDDATVIAVNLGAAPRTLALPATLGGEPIVVAPGRVAIVSRTPEDGGAFVDAILRAPPRTVRVRASGTRCAGAELAVAGNAPEVGAWDPQRARAVSVASTGGGAAELALPASGVYAFKLVQRKGAAVAWSTAADTLVFVPPGDAPLEVTLPWPAEAPCPR